MNGCNCYQCKDNIYSDLVICDRELIDIYRKDIKRLVEKIALLEGKIKDLKMEEEKND